ncbi:MAG: ATP-binding cassette domain-containing protein [Bacteroidota bacterium]
MTITLQAENLKKVFNRRVVFDNVSFLLESPQTLLITGRNGSGKSTLVKILSDVLAPTSGTVTMKRGSEPIAIQRNRFMGFVSPYLQMYEEFSAYENLLLSLAVRGIEPSPGEIDSLLDRLGILRRKHDPVGTYSSGMKQRVKYAFALLHRPPVLILDEPTSNLDNHGIQFVREVMTEYQGHSLLIVATNTLSDVDHYDLRLDLDDLI